MSAGAWQAELTSEDLESFLKEAVMPRTSLALSVATLICSAIPMLTFPTLTHTSHPMPPQLRLCCTQD